MKNLACDQARASAVASVWKQCPISSAGATATHCIVRHRAYSGESIGTRAPPPVTRANSAENDAGVCACSARARSSSARASSLLAIEMRVSVSGSVTGDCVKSMSRFDSSSATHT
jgi:hypothetical protein